MSKNRNQNNLLVEIMIAVLFFALCSTVILETFVAAREFNTRSEIESEALVVMQDLNEQLYAVSAAEEFLVNAGFEQAEDGWYRDETDYRLKLVLKEESTEAGILRNTLIQAQRSDETFLEIPGARYYPGGGIR